MTKVKICGLTRDCDIDFANEVMPEFVGFVFSRDSKRYVAPEKAADLRWKLDYRIAAVGVFVDEKIEAIAELASQEVIDLIQLHGSESNEYIAKLRSMVEIPIIKAFTVRSEEDIRDAEYSDADFVLLDSGKGSGVTFDHRLIRELRRPYFLAGGITPDNAGNAMESLHPYAIDASSGLETNGFKDPEKMRSFIDAIRI